MPGIGFPYFEACVTKAALCIVLSASFISGGQTCHHDTFYYFLLLFVS